MKILKKGVPLDSLNENIKICRRNECCFRLQILIYGIFFLPILPFLLCYLYYYYKKNPRIELVNYKVKEVRCPKCKTGFIDMGILVDTFTLSDDFDKITYICTKCRTLYPDHLIERYL